MNKFSERLQNWISMYRDVFEEVITPWLETSNTYQAYGYADAFYSYEPLRKLAPLIKMYKAHVKWETNQSFRFTKLDDSEFVIHQEIIPELIEETLVLMESIKKEDLVDYLRDCIDAFEKRPLPTKLMALTMMMTVLSPYQLLASFGATNSRVKRGAPVGVVAYGIYDFLTNFGYVSNLKYVSEILEEKLMIEQTDKYKIQTSNIISIGYGLIKLLQDIYFSDVTTEV